MSVIANITPTFNFGTSLNICTGGTVPALPGFSNEGITGVWSPAVVSNTTSGVYTFTPDLGQCAIPATFTITVSPGISPIFTFGPSLNICAGGSVPTLPNTSTNGITGTWSPAIVNNSTSGTYTFTPNTGQCADAVTFTVTVAPTITPSFEINIYNICEGSVAPTLPTTSLEGIAGTWNPPVVSNTTSGIYTFIPNPGQCAVSSTIEVNVIPNITPTFNFGASADICAGGVAPVLTGFSNEGITGVWNPAVVSTTTAGIYTFTPDAGQCAMPATFTATLSPSTTPTFSFGTSLNICPGGSVPTLPNTSTNGITGVWNPAVVNDQNSGTYTFTPNGVQCVLQATFTVTVNPIVTPTFNLGSLSICIGASTPALPGVSQNGISGSWSPSVIDNQNSGSYTFTPSSGQCANPVTLNIAVNEIPAVVVRADTTLSDGDLMPATFFTGTPAGITYRWVNSNSTIGLAELGTGNVPSFIAVNKGNAPIIATITVTPVNGGCEGTARIYKITVKPRNKDIFVPNVFSPNGDGKNDKLFAYGNYVDKLEMRIFNQWGEQIIFINSLSQGWDGTHRGKPQPVGVYVYVLKVTMTDGRIIQMKGSITLLR